MIEDTHAAVDAELAMLTDDEFITHALNRRDDMAKFAEDYYDKGVQTGNRMYLDVAAVLLMTSRVLHRLIQEKLFKPISGSDTIQ